MEFDIVRAWKDARYRQSLTAEQQAMLPENPVGEFKLTDADLEGVHGGSFGDHITQAVFGGDCAVSVGKFAQCFTIASKFGECDETTTNATGASAFAFPTSLHLIVSVCIP